MKKTTALTLACLLSLTACSKEEELVTDSASQIEIAGIPGSAVTESPAVEQAEEALDVQHFGMFISETMDGNEISDSIFADYDLTMVNIWATWCGPCISEMPYLQELYGQLPYNVNLLTVVADGDMQRDLAQEILSSSGATFTTILPSDSININVMPKVEAFPTSVFVDRNGNVAAVVMGVPPGNPTEAYLDYIQQILEILSGMTTFYGGTP